MPPQGMAPVSEPHSHTSLIVAVVGLVAIACVGGVTAYFLLGGSSGDTPPPSGDTPPVADDVPSPPPPAWTEVSGEALTAQTFMGVAVHDDMLMVVGGLQGDASPVKDIVAFDGQTWSKKGEFPVSISRNVVVEKDGTLWSFGGVSPALDPSNTNAIYSSADGMSWTKKGSLPGTRFQSPIIKDLNGTLWSIGGKYTDPTTRSTALSRRVFSSKNGINWLEAGDNALPVAVGGPAAVAFGDTVWIVGGGSLDANQNIQPGLTTFSSSDGQNWEARANAPLSIAHACAVVHSGRVWLVGGETPQGASNAVFSSEDGVSWTTEAVLPQAMTAPGCAVYKGALFVVGNGTAYYTGELTDTTMDPPTLPLGGPSDAAPAQ